MGIRLATGAFRTSRLESLYAESGVPPLSLRMNLLLCGYAAKLATQPHHPAYGAIFRPAFCNRYELNTRVSRPVGVRFHQLLQELNIRLPHIYPCSLSRNPPWEIVGPTCDLWLISQPRGSPSPLTYRRFIAEHLSSYPDHTVVYTDGSFLRGSTDSAFVHDGAAFSYRLRNCNSVFTADLYALYRALLFLRQQHLQCHLICTDSLSALQSLSSYSRDHPIVNEIMYQPSHLQKAGKFVEMCCVPGHTGLAGNEAADATAKAAA
jgi:ribonuclease HI